MYFITITQRYTPNTFPLLLKLEEREKMVVLFISQFFVCYDYLLCLRSRFFVFWVGTSSNSFFSCSSVMRCNSKLTLSFEMLHMQCIFDFFSKKKWYLIKGILGFLHKIKSVTLRSKLATLYHVKKSLRKDEENWTDIFVNANFRHGSDIL